MKELNDLEKKIYKVLTGYSPGETGYLLLQKVEDCKAISQFFLEEIKEVWTNGRDSVGRDGEQLETFEDYLKSKYGI